MKKLLAIAEVKIKEEMDKVGFIDDSDNTERFLDGLSKQLAVYHLSETSNCTVEQVEDDWDLEAEIEPLQEELLEEIKDKIMDKYNKFHTCENGHYAGCYYKDDIKFENWDQFNSYFGLGE